MTIEANLMLIHTITVENYRVITGFRLLWQDLIGHSSRLPSLIPSPYRAVWEIYEII